MVYVLIFIMFTVGIVITTFKARNHLAHCLPPLLNSPLKPRVLVVDSSSNDGTVELAQQMGAETIVIPQSEFNHGATREMARKHLKTDIIVMVTQDAYAIDEHVIEKLIAPLIAGKAAVAYARQIPHDGAGFFEAFAREFNYPVDSHIRCIANVSKYGVYTVFCSDSCAAYLNEALDIVGGFRPVLTGEDTVAAACLLQNGFRVAYVAEACVKHSHGYSLKQEFQRHFDTGIARHDYRHLIAFAGEDEKRGKLYVKTLIRRVVKETPIRLPYACFHVLAKWLGYRIGTASTDAPIWFKKALSSQKSYWK